MGRPPWTLGTQVPPGLFPTMSSGCSLGPCTPGGLSSRALYCSLPTPAAGPYPNWGSWLGAQGPLCWAYWSRQAMGTEQAGGCSRLIN